MKKLTIFILAVFVSFCLSAQNGQKHFDKAYEIEQAETDFHKAIKLYTKAAKDDELYSDAMARRARCHRKVGDYHQAIEDAKTAIGKDKENKLAIKEISVSLVILEKYDLAFVFLDMLIELYPDYLAAYNARGSALIILGQYEKAEQDFNKAIQIDPNISYPWFNRGLTYLWTENYEAAIRDFTQAISLHTLDDHQYYYNRGLAHYFLEDFESASKDLAKAIINNDKQDPFEVTDNALSYYYKGVANYYIGKKSLGCEDLEKAIELGNEDAEEEYLIMECGKEYEFTVDEMFEMLDAAAKEAAAEESSITITVYPNPVVTTSHIQIGIDSNFSINIYDSLGRKIKSYTNQNRWAELNANDFKNGIYVAEIIVDAEPIGKEKFLVNK